MLKLNKSLGSYFYELHQKSNSKMNNKWKYFDVQYINELNITHETYLVSSIQKKIKSRNYNCDESNTVQITKCMDEFYMKEMNCSFPWLHAEYLNLQKCWKNHNIDDLKNLVKKVSKIHENHSEEVEKCLTPNCIMTKWKTKKYVKFKYVEDSVNFIIDSSMVMELSF